MGQKKSLKLAGDFIYTVLGTVVMNVVLQIIIYPLITHFRGDAVTGEILYFMGFVYIIPQALGTALTNTRLVVRKTSDASNCDFARVIVVSSALTALACGFVGVYEKASALFIISYAAFSVLYLLRTYALVEFRLNLKFKQQLLYYCIVSVGYLIGAGLYAITDVWMLIFIVGEAAALAYSLIYGSIFKRDAKNKIGKFINKTFFMVSASTLFRDCVIQFDKVILKHTVGANVVTQYHIVSLIAKTIQMLIGPINTLIMSYLTVKDAAFFRKTLSKFVALSFLTGGIFYGACIVGTPIYLKLFYPSLYAEVIGYNFVVNSGLILGFIASLFMTVLLSQGRTKLHTAIESVFGVLYIAISYHFSTMYGILGFAYVTLIMNAVKTAVSVICLYATIK